MKLTQIRNSFVRQSSANDCGIACLAMIMNYIGRPGKDCLHHADITDERGLSLLELKKIAERSGLACRCVQMDLTSLRSNPSPCILFMINDFGVNHYQVCYRYERIKKRSYYLMADPAKQVYYLTEEQLGKQWQNNAALYFENLPDYIHLFKINRLSSLLKTKFFPNALWISVPLVTLFTAALGVAITWVLQKGLSDSSLLENGRIAFSLITLLLIIILFKGLFSFVRQYLLIIIGAAINKQLMETYIIKLFQDRTKKKSAINSLAIKNDLADIRKIQNAISALLAVIFSDGFLIVLMTAATYYLLPLAGIIVSMLILITLFIVAAKLPAISYSNANITELASATADFILKDLKAASFGKSVVSMDESRDFHLHNHHLQLSSARIFAISLGKINLLIECLGALGVIFIFGLGLLKLNSNSIDYFTFMIVVILNYLTASLLPKICNAVFLVAEGADASIQFNSRVPGSS